MLSNVPSVCAYEHDKLSVFLTSKNENTLIVAVLWGWMVRFVFPAGVDLKAFGISSRWALAEISWNDLQVLSVLFAPWQSAAVKQAVHLDATDHM